MGPGAGRCGARLGSWWGFEGLFSPARVEPAIVAGAAEGWSRAWLFWFLVRGRIVSGAAVGVVLGAGSLAWGWRCECG